MSTTNKINNYINEEYTSGDITSFPSKKTKFIDFNVNSKFELKVELELELFSWTSVPTKPYTVQQLRFRL